MRVGLQFAAFENLVLVVLTLLVAEKKFIHVLWIYLGFSKGKYTFCLIKLFILHLLLLYLSEPSSYDLYIWSPYKRTKL